ncbi:hypothetical protein JCM9279_002370 [Rhodotorula babjevae]
MAPPLPNELLDMIATLIVAGCDDERARIVAGQNLSLVCKQLVGLGRRVLWHRKTMICRDDNLAVARQLVQRPYLLSYTRELRFKHEWGLSMSAWPDRMLDIIYACPSVLQVLQCGPANKHASRFGQGLTFTDTYSLDRLARAPCARHLTSLTVRVALGPKLVADRLASALSDFVGLDELHLVVDFFSWSTDGISQIVEANKLVSIHLDAATSARGCEFCRALHAFVNALRHLPHLKHAHLGSESSSGGADTYKVEGVYFEDQRGVLSRLRDEYKAVYRMFGSFGVGNRTSRVYLRLDPSSAPRELSLRRLLYLDGPTSWGLYRNTAVGGP